MRVRRSLVLAGCATAALAVAGLTAAQDIAPKPAAAPEADAEGAPPDETAPTEPTTLNGTSVYVVPEPVAPFVPEVPQKRPRFTAAVIQAVDKVTAETLRFEAKVGEPVRYKGLVLTVHACESTTPQEGYTDSLAHLEIQSEPEQLGSKGSVRVVYRGWMSSASPGLHPFEHSIYDVWLIACRTAAPSS